MGIIQSLTYMVGWLAAGGGDGGGGDGWGNYGAARREKMGGERGKRA